MGVRCPRQVSRSNLALTRARVNGLGRLSSTTACRAGVLGPTPVGDLDFGEHLFTRTADLIQYAASRRGIGLRDPNPLDALVVFQPADWGPRAFDEINQRFVWLITDGCGHPIPLEVAYDPLHSAAIKWMESAGSFSSCRLVARVAGSGTRISLYPISIIGSAYGENNIFHLALDGAGEQDAAKNAARPPGQTRPDGYGQSGGANNPRGPQDRETDQANRLEQGDIPDDEGAGTRGDEPDYEAESDKGMRGGFAYADPSFTGLEELLETLAESGAGSLNIPCRDRLRGLSEELAGRGLILLARHTGRLAEGDGGFARGLLRCRYICDLHRQALRVGL